MIRYELRGAPSGRVWCFATNRGDGAPVTEAEAREFAEGVGWELHEIADDGTDRVLWSPPAVEISERAAIAIVDFMFADAEMRGHKMPGGGS